MELEKFNFKKIENSKSNQFLRFFLNIHYRISFLIDIGRVYSLTITPAFIRLNRRAHIEFKNFQSNIARRRLLLRTETKGVSEFHRDFPIFHSITSRMQFCVTNRFDLTIIISIYSIALRIYVDKYRCVNRYVLFEKKKKTYMVFTIDKFLIDK